ncbi:hypothetical protein NL474_28410, partial [Klebsiella pneumoniae]|nr:hypothetical protein [Klebsiella pneumoniae]
DDSNGGGNAFASAWFAPPAEVTRSHRVYGNGTIFTYTDTSAKFRKIGIDGGGTLTNNMADPYWAYDANVRATSYSGCRPVGSTGPYYWC